MEPERAWAAIALHGNPGPFIHSDSVRSHRSEVQAYIARALLNAHQRGRREGMEEVAVWHDDQAKAARGWCPASERSHAFSAEAIRTKMEEQPAYTNSREPGEFGDSVTVRTTRS